MDAEVRRERERRVRAVDQGHCPDCGHPLTDPTKSNIGWYWCRNPGCRKPWRVERLGAGSTRLVSSPNEVEIESVRPQRLESGREG